MYIPQDNVREPLYVIAAIFNPVRFKSRWKLYRDFQRHIRESGAILLTVEAAFGERDFALEDHASPNDGEFTREVGEEGWQSHGPANVPPSACLPHQRLKQDYIKVRVDHLQEVWLKENLLNIGLQHLPDGAKYVAFIDADVHFTRPDWVSETLHALQHYHVIQMFSTAINLSPHYEPTQAIRGWCYSHCNGLPVSTRGTHYVPGHHGAPGAWHTGFAWAWRIEALDFVGGLIEHGILGAGDNHMARALVGRALESINVRLAHGYRQRVLTWERRALEHIKMNIGYIEGMITHSWHGRITNRNYQNRWKLLIEHQFDPDHDLKKDRRGVIRLTDKKPALRDDIRRYFRARSEDSIDMPNGEHRIVSPTPIIWQRD